MLAGMLLMAEKRSSVGGKGSQSCWQNDPKGELAESKDGWGDAEVVQGLQQCGCWSHAKLVELAEEQKIPLASPAERKQVRNSWISPKMNTTKKILTRDQSVRAGTWKDRCPLD